MGKRKRVVLGITASAAAFKSVALASLLRKGNLAVDAVMSGNSLKMISPHQIACVSGGSVYTDQFAESPANPCDYMPHITLTENLDLMVVAPATANFLARIAAGFADELITSVVLACEAPVILAPSMNSRMWNNEATVENVRCLKDRGFIFAGPVEGELACGGSGQGRMMEPEDIFRMCLNYVI